MNTNCLTLLMLSLICGSLAQFDLGEVCETDNGGPGICKYEHACKYANEIKNSECGYEGNTLIVCCPKGFNTGLLNRFYSGIEEVIPNDKMTFHNDGPEPEECPPLPHVPTPPFDKLTHTIAYEKCAANERYVHVCERNETSYWRRNTCRITHDSERISGGVPALPFEFPHMTLLGCDSGIERNSEIIWVGGGSLISDKYILTAAHVLLSHYGQIRHAFLGSLDKTDMRSGELYGIINLIPHKLYSSENKYHDIALVLLNRRVTFTEFIRPICLPVPGAIISQGSERTVAGWGLNGVANNTSNLLQKSSISIVNSDECRTSLKFAGFVWNDDTLICARGWNTIHGFTGSFQGDSGGPLMYEVTNKEFNCNYVVDGVVSWGGVGARGVPASYTRVSAYLDWIVETVWPEELQNRNGSLAK